ncbi:hypothetical protein [Novosphingobium sp. MBES04]|uniref:hypothetical protein n=1 Tax=Novosphingobium sp. MBES04 TaxID=1206458 RepID=UPI0011864038|nr:hypothetical protein [Novosphingobium sp. MBES04]
MSIINNFDSGSSFAAYPSWYVGKGKLPNSLARMSASTLKSVGWELLRELEGAFCTQRRAAAVRFVRLVSQHYRLGRQCSNISSPARPIRDVSAAAFRAAKLPREKAHVPADAARPARGAEIER